MHTQFSGRVRRRAAFTLTELLVAVIIIGVLAAVAVTAFGKYRSNAADTAASASASALRDAITARSAADDTSAQDTVVGAWVAGGQLAVLSALGASFDGVIAYQPPALGRPAELRVDSGGRKAAITLPDDPAVAASILPASGGATSAAGFTQVDEFSTLSGSVAAAFSPVSNIFASVNFGSSTSSVSTYSLNEDTGKSSLIGTYPTGTLPRGVAFSPDGHYLAAASESSGDVSMFTVAPSGQLTPIGRYPSDPGASAIEFAPNGRYVAVANRSAGTATVLRVAAGGSLTKVSSQPAGSSPRSVSWSPDGRFLAVGGYLDRVVNVYTADPDTGALSGRTSTTVAWSPAALTFTPDGLSLYVSMYTGSQDDVPRVRFSVDLAAHTIGQPETAALGGASWWLAVSPDGSTLAVANVLARTVTQYRITPVSGMLTQVGEPAAVPQQPEAIAFSPDGKFLAVPCYTTSKFVMLKVN